MNGSMIVGVVIVALIFLWVGKIIFSLFTGNRGGMRHCMTCGVDDRAKTITRGSTAIELILWLCFIVPGLIYSIWRLNTRYEGCASCGAKTLVPMKSPAAVAHRKTLGTEAL